MLMRDLFAVANLPVNIPISNTNRRFIKPHWFDMRLGGIFRAALFYLRCSNSFPAACHPALASWRLRQAPFFLPSLREYNHIVTRQQYDWRLRHFRPVCGFLVADGTMQAINRCFRRDSHDIACVVSFSCLSFSVSWIHTNLFAFYLIIAISNVRARFYACIHFPSIVWFWLNLMCFVLCIFAV